MKKQDGIALIATLLIMAAILALGVGSLFLTGMNLKISENNRSHAVARYNAEAGIEAAILQISRDHAASTSSPKQLPAALILPTPPDTHVTYKPIGSGSTYTHYSSGGQRTTAQVVVVGTGPNNALYQSEVFIELGSGSKSSIPTPPPELLYGFASEGTCTVNKTATYIKTTMRCNTGFALNNLSTGQFQNCLQRAASGVCGATEVQATGDIPVFAGTKQASYTCAPSTFAGVCQASRPIKYDTPVTISANYRDRRDDAIAKALGLERYRSLTMQNTRELLTGSYYYATPSAKDRPSTSLPISISGSMSQVPYAGKCTKTFSSSVSYNNPQTAISAGFTPGSTICVNGDVTLPEGVDLVDMTVIVQGSINFNGGSVLTVKNSTLITRTGGINLNRALSFTDSTIYSQGDLNFNGKGQTGSTYGGNATLASAGSININGNSSATKCGTGEELCLGAAFIAEGDINVNSDADWYAASIAGGTFNYNKNTRLYGSVAAKKGITANQGIYVDNNLKIINKDLTSETWGGTGVELSPQIASRR